VVIDPPVAITMISPASSPTTFNAGTTTTMQISFKTDGPENKQIPYIVTCDKGSVTPLSGNTTAGSTTNLTFTAPSQNALCTVTIAVSNGTDTAKKVIQINVTGITPPTEPVFHVESITASPETVAPGGTSTISAVVENPASANVTYTWTCKYGTISGSGSSVIWTAPQTVGVYGIYLSVSDGTTVINTGVPVTVSGPTGGLLGQYYKTTRDKNVPQLTTLVFTRIDPNINFTWYQISPDPRIPVQGWGARWTGFVKCDAPGTYQFRVHVDDGARMLIVDDNGNWQWTIPGTSDNWSDHDKGAWLPATPIAMNLAGGKWYPIRLDFFQGAENAFITLYWSINGGPEEIVPQDCLKPPSN
jgi:hypothetical protein